MRYTIATIFCCFIYSFCDAQTYTIHGKIKNLQCDSLLILKIKQGIYEGAKIKITNGYFSYTDSIREPYFVQILKLKKNSQTSEGKLTELLVTAGEIKILGDDARPASIQIEGSEPDYILKRYLKEDELLGKEWNALKTEYDNFAEKNDTLNRKKIAQQLNQLTFEKRIPLLKQYVFANASNVIGALIPNFCTLGEVLKKEDYLDMFNILSPEMQQTNYGKSVYNKAH